MNNNDDNNNNNNNNNNNSVLTRILLWGQSEPVLGMICYLKHLLDPIWQMGCLQFDNDACTNFCKVHGTNES